MKTTLEKVISVRKTESRIVIPTTDKVRVRITVEGDDRKQVLFVEGRLNEALEWLDSARGTSDMLDPATTSA